MAQRKYTGTDIKFIKDNQKMKIKELAKHFGIEFFAMRNFMYRNNLQIRKLRK